MCACSLILPHCLLGPLLKGVQGCNEARRSNRPALHVQSSCIIVSFRPWFGLHVVRPRDALVICRREVCILPSQSVLCPASNQAMEQLAALLQFPNELLYNCTVFDCKEVIYYCRWHLWSSDDILGAEWTASAGEPQQLDLQEWSWSFLAAPRLEILRNARVTA